MRALVASAERDGAAGLRFRYVLDADLNAIRIPALRSAQHADELWKHTCFEAFIAASSGGDEYRELNFSPSTEWAAYSFEGYREGMASIALPSLPSVAVTRSAALLILEAHVTVQDLLPEAWLAPGAMLQMALSAVIEDDDGRITYWALRHAPDKPDFHHPAGFILEV